MSGVGQFDDASDDEDEEITGVIKEIRATPANNGNNGDDNNDEDDDDEVEIVKTVPAKDSTAATTTAAAAATTITTDVDYNFIAKQRQALALVEQRRQQKLLREQQHRLAVEMAQRESLARDIIARRQQQQQAQEIAQAQVYKQMQVERQVQADQLAQQQRTAAHLHPTSTATVESKLPIAAAAAAAPSGEARLFHGGELSANSKSSVRSGGSSNSKRADSSPAKPKKKRGGPRKLPLSGRFSGEGKRESVENVEKEKLAVTHRLLLGQRTNNDVPFEGEEGGGNKFNQKLPASTKKQRGLLSKVSLSSDAGGDVSTSQKKRGRPRKEVSESPNYNAAGAELATKKKRGRPPKQQGERVPRINYKKKETPKKKFSILEPPLEGPVMLASQLVGDELRNGLWPSPLNKSEDSADAGNTDDRDEILVLHAAHKNHMTTVAEVLDSFARNVILQSMQKSADGHATAAATHGKKRDLVNEKSDLSDVGTNHHNTATGSINQTSRRDSRHQSRDAIKNCCASKPFVGALLMLREVMTQNSLTIFGETCLNEAVDGESASGSARPIDSISNVHDDRKEELAHSAKLIATSVIVAVIERYMTECGDDGGVESALSSFFKVANAYDEAHPEFASHLQLERLNRGILRNGDYLNEEEDIARSASFNTAVKRHPLIVLNEEKKIVGKKKRRLLRLPEPNVCHVAYANDNTEEIH